METFDLLIRNGCLVDGTGAPRRQADIGVRDGRIERIASTLTGARGRREIDAAGRIVAPGVIDPHTHYDAQIHWDPYCTNSSWHGATTVVVGNCGFGFSPCRADARERYMAMMENTEQVPLPAMRTALGWDWESFPEWIEHMQRLPKGINLASYLPLNSLMMFVMGYPAAKQRGATAAERARMRDLLHQAMDAGAIGFALSHLNEFNTHKDCDGSAMPTDQMVIDDAFHLAEVLRERDQGVIQCLCELPGGVGNRATAETLARISGRPVLHNVVAPFDAMPEYHESVLAWLDQMAAEGLSVYSQAFAFRAWNEFTVVEFNAWGNVPLFASLDLAAGAEAKARLAADPAYRERARREYDPAAMVVAGGALESFILHATHGADAFQAFAGQALGQIAQALGQPVTDVFFEIVAASGAHAEFRTANATSTDPDRIAAVLSHPRTVPGTSDGGAHVKFHSGGQYPTDNLMCMVREEQRMTLEEMHAKLSHLPAQLLGLHNRGALLEGYAADLYVYDFERLDYVRGRYEVVHDLPDGDWRRVCPAAGIDWVVCNGEPIFHDGVATGHHPGRLLGNGGPEIDAALQRRVA
ncbi:MAG: amidohydrolase family protein [Pseudomonadales bacterium]